MKIIKEISDNEYNILKFDMETFLCFESIRRKWIYAYSVHYTERWIIANDNYIQGE